MADAPALARPASSHAAPIALRVVRLILAYDGAAYHGWQVQPGLPTVQGLLATAARALLGAETTVVGASRTDAGVHARGQCAAIRTTSSLPARAVRNALNAALPEDVRVLRAEDVAPDFDPRRSVVVKRYLYLLDTGEVADPLLRRYAWHVGGRLDWDAARDALSAVRGRHDFSAFCAASARAADPVCTLRGTRLVRRRGRVALLFTGDRFLHHMVRTLVGSALVVARRRREADWLGQVLEGRDRTRAGPTAPARGLVLLRVLYRR